MTVTRYGYSGVYKIAVKRYGYSVVYKITVMRYDYSVKSRKGLRTKKNEQHR